MSLWVVHTAGAAKRLGGASLLLAIAACGVFVIPGATALLEYERSAIAAGQVWRLVTCHWTHWSLDHLLWDVVAFVVLSSLCERSNRTAWLKCLGIAAIAIPIVLWQTMPEIAHYRGLSGIVSALFLQLAVALLVRKATEGGWISVVAISLLTAAFAVKIGYESLTGNAVFSDNIAAGFVAVPLAHAVGAAVGIVLAVWHPRRPRARSEQPGLVRSRGMHVRLERNPRLRFGLGKPAD